MVKLNELQSKHALLLFEQNRRFLTEIMRAPSIPKNSHLPHENRLQRILMKSHPLPVPHAVVIRPEIDKNFMLPANVTRKVRTHLASGFYYSPGSSL